MGNIESGEMGSFWDNMDASRGYPHEGSSRRASYYSRDDEIYRDDSSRRRYHEEGDYGADERGGRDGSFGHKEKDVPEPTTTTAATAEEVSSTTADVEAPAAAETSGSAVDGGHEAVEASSTVTREVNISKHQKTNQVAPEAMTTAEAPSSGSTVRVRSSRIRAPSRDLPFAVLFILHVALVFVAILFLNVKYLQHITQSKLHNLERWFPELSAAVVVGSLSAPLFQTLFRFYPNIMVRSVSWVSCVLTLGASLMLIATSTGANLGVGILCLIFCIIQCLYALWTRTRLKYAGDLLFCSLNTAKKVSGIYIISYWVLLMAAVWLFIWSFGVVSALSFHLAALVIMGLLASMAWMLHTLRNVVYTTTAKGVSAVYSIGPGDADQGELHWEGSLHAAFTAWFGSICLGSLVVPVVHFLNAIAKAIKQSHVDSEFMFSCADCFISLANKASKSANNFAYVQVALNRKPFIEASKYTSNLFAKTRLDLAIEKDLTNALCVFSGISGGMICVLVSGGWTFGTHKALTSSVSIIAFFIGYFLVRIAMAVPQGAVSAHYVCYGENPSSHELLSSPVPERLKELLAEADMESGNKS